MKRERRNLRFEMLSGVGKRIRVICTEYPCIYLNYSSRNKFVKNVTHLLNKNLNKITQLPLYSIEASDFSINNDQPIRNRPTGPYLSARRQQSYIRCLASRVSEILKPHPATPSETMVLKCVLSSFFVSSVLVSVSCAKIFVFHTFILFIYFCYICILFFLKKIV